VRPTAERLVGIPATFCGYTGAGLRAGAAAAALRRGRVPDAAPLLGLIALVGAAAAFLSSQLEPAWAARYAAVLFGPLLLALAAVLARAPRWSWAALAGVAALWLTSAPVPAKSNVRTVAGDVAPAIRAGDLVVSTQPEQVPVLDRYLPPGLRYLTPLGRVADPRMTDWRDGVARLRAGSAVRVLAPWVARLSRGQHVLLVMPVYRNRSPAPWTRAVRARTREWRRWLRADPRLRSIGRAPRSTWPPRHSSVRTELFAVR
jgi:hypothetical protein